MEDIKEVIEEVKKEWLNVNGVFHISESKNILGEPVIVFYVDPDKVSDRKAFPRKYKDFIVLIHYTKDKIVI